MTVKRREEKRVEELKKLQFVVRRLEGRRAERKKK